MHFWFELSLEHYYADDIWTAIIIVKLFPFYNKKHK